MNNATIRIQIVGPTNSGKTSLALNIETLLCQLGLAKNVVYFSDETPERQDALESNVGTILANKTIVIEEVTTIE